MINGATEIALTKLDVLEGLKELKVCTEYEIDGITTKNFPLQPKKLEIAKPIYETLPGFDGDITSCKKVADLPANAKKYVDYIEKKLGVPIRIVSVGPKREETILV